MLAPDTRTWPWQAVLDRFADDVAALPGGEIAYRAAGDGPPVVLLHGIGSGSGSWAYQLEELGERYRLIAWDAPGYGRSNFALPDWPTASDYGAALGRLLDHLEIGRCLVVGHSLGALMGARFAVAHPDRVAGLVLADPAAGHGRLPEDERRRRIAYRLDRFDRLGAAAYAENRAGSLLSAHSAEAHLALVRWNMARLSRAGLARAARLLAAADIYEDADRLAAPVQVVWGAEDGITPPDDCRAVAERIATASPSVAIEGAGHACYIEAASRFNALVRDFAEGLP